MCKLKWSVQVNVLLNNCKQNITSLSLLVGTTVIMILLHSEKKDGHNLVEVDFDLLINS